jgi:hypothetical protein
MRISNAECGVRSAESTRRSAPPPGLRIPHSAFRILAGLGLVALLTGVALLTHAEGLYLAMHNDYSVWIRVARDWQSGLTLYEETPDNKLPTLFLFIRLIDGPRPEVSLYLAESFLAVLGGLTLFFTLRSSIPKSALPAALLLIAWTGTSGTFYGAQITEAISVWLDVFAMCLLFFSVTRGRRLLAFLAGALFFLMVTFRVPTVLHALAYIPLLFVSFREWGTIKTAQLVAAFVGGVLLALLVLLLHVHLAGYWQPFLDNLARNYRYGALHRTPFAESVKNCLATVSQIILRNPGFLLMIALSILLVKPWLSRNSHQGDAANHEPDHSPLAPHHSLFRHSPLTTHHSLFLWIGLFWLAGAIAGAFPGGRHFPHYYHVIWPPIAILSTLWLSSISNGSRASSPGSPLTIHHSPLTTYARWALPLAFVFLAILFNARGLLALASGQELVHRTEVRQAADSLSQITSPNEPVAVCVWDQWAELYWRVPRPGVTRCVAPQCFYGFQQELFDEWVQAMLAHPPDLIVADGSLLGPSCINSKYDNTEFRPPPGDPFYTLRQRVNDDYFEIERIGDLSFLARRGGSHDAQPGSAHRLP